MIIRNARVFNGTDFAVGDFGFRGETFSEIAQGESLDAAGCYAIPALVDQHFHGCVGYDFCDGTQEAFSAIAQFQASVGVGAMCPATMTFPEEKLMKIARAAAAYENERGGAELVGIHMEGPFLSAEKKGAQNPAYLALPDAALFRRLQQAAGGLFKLCTLAPELEGAMESIRLISREVRVSLGHTVADYDTAVEAFGAGAKQATHLYNAMPPFSHRAPGVIGAAFDEAETVELIADGVHVHPAAVRATFSLFGAERICLISDSMMATGLSDGQYSLGGQDVTVRDNRATLADGTIAGSATCLLDCLRIAVRDMGIPLAGAVRAATLNPASALGIDDRYGSIAPGKTASFLLLEQDLAIRAIYIRGSRIQ